MADGAVVDLGVDAAEYGADPGEQLGQAEGLDQVVVGAFVQRGDAVGLLAAGGDDEDGAGPARGEPAADVQALGVGQAEVEQHHVGGRGGQRLRAGDRRAHRVAGPLEPAHQRLRDARIVLDDEDTGGGRLGGAFGGGGYGGVLHGNECIEAGGGLPSC